MAKVPKPGMPQEEKDKLGQPLHEQVQRDAQLEDLARTVAEWRPDVELAGMTPEQLRAEAERRRVQLPKSISNEEVAKRLTQRRKEVDDFIERRQRAAATPPTGQ